LQTPLDRVMYARYIALTQLRTSDNLHRKSDE